MNRLQPLCNDHFVEAMGLEPTNLLTASQALYQLSYAPSGLAIISDLPSTPKTQVTAATPP